MNGQDLIRDKCLTEEMLLVILRGRSDPLNGQHMMHHLEMNN